MRFTVSIPPGSQRGPQYMDQALAAMHHALHRRDPLGLLIDRFAGHVGLAFECSSRLRPIVQQQLAAQYPACEITVAPARGQGPGPSDNGTGTDRPDRIQSQVRTWTMSVRLAPDVFPLKTYRRFEDLLNRTTADPLASLLAAVGDDDMSPLQASIEIRVRPARRAVVLRARRLLKDLDRPLFHRWGRLMLWYAQARRSASWLRRATTWGLGCLLALASPHGRHEAPDGQREHLQRAVEKLDEHLFEATILLRVTGPQDRSQDAPHRLHAMLAALGTFNNTEFAAFQPGRMRRSAGNCRHGSPFLLSAAELATLWHPASETVQTPGLATVLTRQLEPPVELPLADACSDVAVLGTTLFRGSCRPFGLLPDDRRRHLAILGKTGMGKTTLLQSLIAADIAAGRGLAVIDPHGDLAESIQHRVPSHRTN